MARVAAPRKRRAPLGQDTKTRHGLHHDTANEHSPRGSLWGCARVQRAGPGSIGFLKPLYP
jgi:hypothetical protein